MQDSENFSKTSILSIYRACDNDLKSKAIIANALKLYTCKIKLQRSFKTLGQRSRNAHLSLHKGGYLKWPQKAVFMATLAIWSDLTYIFAWERFLEICVMIFFSRLCVLFLLRYSSRILEKEKNLSVWIIIMRHCSLQMFVTE